MLITPGSQRQNPTIYPRAPDHMSLIIDTLTPLSTPWSPSIFIVSEMNAYLKCGLKTKERSDPHTYLDNLSNCLL